MISRANPQWLTNGVPAPHGSPQTQYVATPDSTLQEIADAAESALHIYDVAHINGVAVIPPAGLYTGTDCQWHPASTLTAPGSSAVMD